MDQEKKIVILNEDFRKSVTHERPEPRNNAPTARPIPNSSQQNANAPERQSKPKDKRK
jgi:hypothetical protein